MKYLFLTAVIFFMMTGFSFAQSTRESKDDQQDKKDEKGYYNSRGFEERAANSPSAIFYRKHERKKERGFLGIFKRKKKTPYSFDEKIEEYEELMEANAKKYRKRAKEMEKPQYSDPTYFGHKKKPKKRPPGKKKFCKECGIVH